jgi:hypothetical protein
MPLNHPPRGVVLVKGVFTQNPSLPLMSTSAQSLDFPTWRVSDERLNICRQLPPEKFRVVENVLNGTDSWQLIRAIRSEA